MRDAASITPACPRCGYDQSGEAAAWTDRCPVHGRCPECGTRFGWADLFDPERQDLGWLVEHAAGVRQAARRTPVTLMRIVRPWAFWRAVGVLARVRLGRLAAWCLALTLVLHVATGGMLYQSEYAWLRRWFGARGMTLAQIHAHALQESLLTSVLDIEWTAGGGRTFLVALQSLTVTGIAAPNWAVAMFGYSVVWVLILTAVPVTRRASRLCPTHIGRAALIALLAPLLAVEAERLALAVRVLWRGTLLADQMLWIVGVLSGLLFVWTIAWWHSAARSGWGLHRQGPLVALATLGGLLGAALAVIVLKFDSVTWMLHRWT
jgi:hypothetical protein